MTEESGKNYWFVAKRYGYGWTPATWQGWAVFLVWLAAVLAALLCIRQAEPKSLATDLLGVGFTLASMAVLIAICYKTGEKPRWRWGKDA